MKVLKVVLISLLVLIVVLFVAAVIIVKTVDVNKFKPQIVEQAGKALGRKVDFSSASLGIGFNGLGVKIDGLSVSEDPAFGTGDFLTVKGISIGVDVLGYLFKRQISITGILIDSPGVTIIRDKNGAVNAATIAKAPEGAPQQNAPAAQAALPALLISSIKAQGGVVKYIDQTFQPPIAMDVTDLSVIVHKLSLTDPFSFTVNANVFGDRQNIKAEGKCQLDLKDLSAKVSDLKVSTDLARLALSRIPKAVPMVPADALPEQMKGNVDVSIPTLVAGAKGLTKMDCDVIISNGYMKFKQMASPITDIQREIKITEKDILVNSLSAVIGQGKITGTGWLKNYLAGQDFSFEAEAQDLSVVDLVAQGQLPVKAEGLISAKGQIKGHGFTPDALRSNLVGQASAQITKAKLKDLNVLRTVLDQLSAVPVAGQMLGQSIETGLPPKYQQKLQEKDTVFSDMTIPVTIVSGRANIPETLISSPELFTFKAKGSAGLDGTYDLEGDFMLSQDLSKSMVASVPQFQYLLNADGMIDLPLKVTGTAGAKMQFNLDAGYIARKMVENQAQQQIMKGLNKLFGGQGAPQQTPQQQAPQQQPGVQQQSGTQQDSSQSTDTAVKDLIHGLFK
ncbi:MAG: AsmA family protein [Deltaproteobacteria bacterium]